MKCKTLERVAKISTNAQKTKEFLIDEEKENTRIFLMSADLLCCKALGVVLDQHFA